MIAAIFYVSNWWYIAKDVNYFEQFSFMPLKHLWSLAIEEQFYLFFPAVLLLFMAIVKKKKCHTDILDHIPGFIINDGCYFSTSLEPF